MLLQTRSLTPSRMWRRDARLREVLMSLIHRLQRCCECVVENESPEQAYQGIAFGLQQYISDFLRRFTRPLGPQAKEMEITYILRNYGSLFYKFLRDHLLDTVQKYSGTMKTSNFSFLTPLGPDCERGAERTLYAIDRSPSVYSALAIANPILRVGASLYYLPISGLC